MERDERSPFSFLSAPWGFLQRRADRTWYPAVRDALLALAIALLGVGAALILVAPWREPAPPVERIRIGGVEVETGDPRPEAVVKEARRRLQEEVTLTGPDLAHRTTWAALGAEVDMESVGRALVELAREGSPAATYYREEAEGPGRGDVPLPISLSGERALESIVALKDAIDRRPRRARFDFEEERVVSERPGISVDVYGTLAALDEALAEGRSEVTLAVESVPAQVTEEDLADIDIGAVVGFFETPYSRMRKDRDRTHNVQLGASMLDGEVIMPGQVLSFNDTLGDRTEARGFRYAPVIAGGALVEGMGGGTCQVASTLYAAAFFSGLVIVERQPHSRPSSYIKLGIDATVSYPDLDLVLQNPFDFPVAIHFVVEDGTARAEFRGRERPYTVTLLRKIIDIRPFPVREIDDSRLPRGEEVITQLGVPGFTVRRYQIIERDKIAYRYQTKVKYPPTVQFVRRGISDPADLEEGGERPKPDSHKPYRATTYLRMVQGAGDLWYESSHE